MIDPFEQAPEDDLLAALRADIQRNRGVTTVGKFTLAELEEAIANHDVVEGPYVRELPDGRQQFYAYLRD